MKLKGCKYINIGTDEKPYYVPKPSKELVEYYKNNKIVLPYTNTNL